MSEVLDCCRCERTDVRLIECPRCGEMLCHKCYGREPSGRCMRCVDEIRNAPQEEEISGAWCEPFTVQELKMQGFDYRTFQTKHGRYYQAIYNDYYITVKQKDGMMRYQVAFVNERRLRYITCSGFLSAMEILRVLDACAISEGRALGWDK